MHGLSEDNWYYFRQNSSRKGNLPLKVVLTGGPSLREESDKLSAYLLARRELSARTAEAQVGVKAIC